MQPGDLVADRFEVERLAGTGGMGEVFRARDRHTGEPVALKALHQAHGGERFAREAVLLAELRHPAIVRYIAHGTTPAGEQYLAMEWLEGKDLSDRLRERGRLGIDESVALAARVAEALAVAHQRKIIHRDIKPSNLYLVGGQIERVRLLDFGVARASSGTRVATKTGQLLGTPGYMAPEQARGDPLVDARADVFSLGCVLFECLTGRAAFVGEHVMALLAKILLEDVPRASSLCAEVTPALDDLCAAMLAKDPDRRPRDGAAVAAAIEALGTLGTARPALSIAPASSLTTGEQRLLCVVTAGTAARDTLLCDATATAPTMAESQSGGEGDLRAVVGRHGGRLEQLHDGSVVVTLTGRGSAIDQVAQAARCALAMRALLPGAGISLATGRGVMAERWPVGEVIERAVKFLRVAEKSRAPEGGEPRPIRIDDVTAGLLGVRFDVGGDARGLVLRGEREADEGARTLLGQPTPCVGRDVDLRTLDAIFGEVRGEPMARAVLVTAPTGVGKSRLRYEFLRRLREQEDAVEVWIARGDPMSAGSPFGMLGQAVRRSAGVLDGEPLAVRQRKLAARVERHLPAADVARVTAFLGELSGAPFADGEIGLEGAGLGAAALQLRAARQDPMLMGDQMRRAFEDFLAAECRAQPVVLVLEDLHWGDLPTVKFIEAALRSLADEPLLVLALARPEVHDLFPKLWADRAVTQMTLGELSRKAAEKLARHVLGKEASSETVGRVIERAAGNAFYLEELLRAVAEGKGDTMPETVVAMVQARLEALEADARRVLRAASVFGQAFWRRGVRALLGAAEADADADAWLGELVVRELVSRHGEARFPGEDEFAFRNALVREAAYAMLTDQDRATGHGLAADWLAQAGETDPMVLAEHFERGGVPLRAVEQFRRAAEQALEGNDFAAALERAGRGIALGATGEVLASLYLVAAKAHSWRGEQADAEVRALQALAIAERGGAAWCGAVMHAAVAAGKLGDDERLDLLAADVGALLAERAPRGTDVVAASVVAQRLLLAGRYDAADELLERMARAGDEAWRDDGYALTRVHQTRALRASFAGDTVGYLTLTEASAVGLEKIGDLRLACSARANVGFAYAEIGQYALAEAKLREARAAAERMGLVSVAVSAGHNLGMVLGHLGRLDEARALEAAMADALAQQGNRRLEAGARMYLAAILSAMGDHDGAEREARSASESTARPIRCAALATLARVHLAKGHVPLAAGAAREAMDLLEELGTIDEAEPLVRLVYAEALEATGAHEDARAAIARARERLLERAAAISDPAWRASFLENVPENARTLELASAWLG